MPSTKTPRKPGRTKLLGIPLGMKYSTSNLSAARESKTFRTNQYGKLSDYSKVIQYEKKKKKK